MTIERLQSAIYNNVISGLKGSTVNISFTLEQIEDAIINERLQIIKEYTVKNLIPIKDLTYSIRCIEVDCESLDRCPCSVEDITAERVKHIELPQIINDFGADGISFIGSTDGLVNYTVYTNAAYRQHKFRTRGGSNPYVWIDTTPNKNNMIDGFIFNASSVLKTLLVRLIPKDPRQLANYGCCTEEEINNISFIDSEIEKRVTEKYIRYYRQMALANTPNDQTIKA